MPKKKSKDTPEAQSRRFVETAKALGSDESGESFSVALGIMKIAPPKNKRQKRPVRQKK